ncbi:PAS domain-containing sensor histidine kinase [Herminiimonas fonticola]|uniref:PAS domain S-box-containing protein n=1 Tax=Herminiimonas fonticola TaxID=303380 RepID=A0A4R6GHL4_9BURK|nr:PAS domain-containing protein [Herminiimonas fonticola]RBA25355.1 PAS domain S-box protein [Herminiimonas fonticola]TDN94469.1 PAS domain S-box-containing protein [Herminiimonas fonticola]
MFQSAGHRKSFTFLLAPLIAATFILTVGIVAIYNVSQDFWVLGYRLEDIAPIRTKTGTVFILAALALAFHSFHIAHAISRTIAKALASVFALCVLVAGASALLRYFFGIELGLETLFVKLGVQGKFWLYESPLTALGFVLVGFCLLLLDYRTSGGHYPSEYIAFILIGMMGIPLVGHLYNVMSVGVVDAARTMLPFMSLTFLILGLGILAARPSHRLMRLWNSQSPGGPILRRLLPNSLLMLIILDFAIKWGVQNRFYDADKASPLLIMLSGTLLFIMFCRTAALLNREYEGRQIGEAALAESNALLRAVSDNTPDAIFVKDRNGRMIFANPAKLRLLGKKREQVIGLRSEELYLEKEDAARVKEEDQSVILGGKPKTFETTTRYAHGTRTMHSTKAPWLDAKGQVVGLVGISTDITERKRMEDALKAHETQLEALVAARTFEVSELIGHLETTREEEKRSIARELHDDLGAALTALNMHLSLIFQQMPPEPKFTERSVKIKALLSSITDATRRIQNGLRPDKLDVFGVKIAIAEQAAEFEKYTGVVCNVNLPDDQLCYAPRVDIALFRIVQEALNNIAKHAKATHVDIVLDDIDDEIVLTVRDNGIGIPAVNPGGMTTHGLRGMRERVAYLGGTVRVSGAEGKGTAIVITIPKTPENTAVSDDNAMEENG